MYYNVYIITIFSFLKVHPSAPAEAASIAQKRCIASALAVRDLIHLHRAKWRRIEHWPLEYMQLMTVCLFTLLEDLDTAGSSRQAFIDISVVARQMSRRFQLARGMLRLVQLTARWQKIELPEEVRPVYQDFEREWFQARSKEKFSSSYPNFALALRSIAATSGNNHEHGENDGSSSTASRKQVSFVGSVELDLFLREWDDSLRIDNP